MENLKQGYSAGYIFVGSILLWLIVIFQGIWIEERIFIRGKDREKGNNLTIRYWEAYIWLLLS